MLSELSEFGLYTNNRAYLEAILESLSAEGDIAYAVIVDSQGRSGGRTPDLRCARHGRPAADAGRGRAARGRHDDGDGADDPRTALRRADRARRRHEDRHRDGTDAGAARARRRRRRRASRAAGRVPIGYVRARDDVRPPAAAVPQAPRRRAVGHRAADRAHDRRHVPADARPRRADAPADARGARGGLRQARRVRSGALLRRARPPHAHVQPHDAAALRIAGGGRELPADARGEGRAAHARARDRDGARVQARAARHPHRAAEPRAPQPAAEADPRAVAAQRHARRVPLPRLRPLQAHQRHARPRRRATSCCRRWRSGSPPPCANPTRSRGWAATSSS